MSKLYLFLEKAGVYLLVAFALSLLITALIAIKYQEKIVYEVKTFDQGMSLINLSTHDYRRTISLTEYQALKQKESSINWVGLTALLGWMGVHPGFKRGIKKIKLFVLNNIV